MHVKNNCEKGNYMKKVLAALLILMMLIPAFGLAEGTETGETTETAEKLPVNLNYDYDELVVGTTMPMHGAFSLSNFGNAGSDVDVRVLIHGYNLVEWNNEEGGFRLNPSVVSGQVVEREENGDHVYNLILCDDLFYSDGTQVTAYDYAFSWLLQMDPVIAELNGTPSPMNYLVGYDDYISGNTDTLAGISVSGPNQITIRINADYLPFFYEVGLLDCYPIPASVVAPGCEVQSDDNGIRLSTPLSAETLKETLLDPKTGYLSHPSVTTGAYKLVSYDGEAKEARFELNEYYKGNSDGVKPVIPRIVFREANQETMIEDLANAKFGLLNKVTRVEAVQQATQLITDTGRYRNTPYPRAGLSFIAFNTERAGVADVAVRQAISRCLDKTGLTTDYTGGSGLAADGFYGIGQWMFQIINGNTEPPMPEEATEQELEELNAAWDEVTLSGVTIYEFDPEAAAAALEADGWKLNANGIREKEIDGNVVTLELKMLYPVNTPVRETLEKRFVEPLKQAGIALTLEESDSVLPMYYGQQERDYDMIWLATNFDVMFDPSPWFEPEGPANRTGIRDQELYELAADMKKTDPGDLLTYCQKWVKFLQVFAEDVPMIPVYSNVYFDYYPDVLQNYEIASNITWSQAIVPSYLSDPPEETAADEATETNP